MNWVTRLLSQKDGIFSNKTESDILSLPANNISPIYSDIGALYIFSDLVSVDNSSNNLMEWATSPKHGSQLALYLVQLVGEGIAQISENSFLLHWADIYYLHNSEDHTDSLYLLGLPEIKKSILSLVERGTLSNPDFSISINGYVDPQGRIVQVDRTGAIFTNGNESWLASAAEWVLISNIIDFENEKNIEKNQQNRECHWGQIRTAALNAGAMLSAYLASVIVLTPDNLIINYSRKDITGIGVAVIEPSFIDAPEDWLSKFDSYTSVPKYIDFSTSNGRMRVIFTDSVHTVLQTIKKEFPGRRAGGAKAEAFIRNPFAFLGDDASNVIDSVQIEKAKEQAGIVPTRLTFSPPRVENGLIKEIVGLVQQIFNDGTSRTTPEKITSPLELTEVVNVFSSSCKEQRQFFNWRTHIIDIDGDTDYQLNQAARYLSVWQTQIDSIIKFEDIYTFKQYAERVDGIGIAKPVYSAYIQKKGGDKIPWTPENLAPLVTAQLIPDGPPVFIYLDSDWIKEFHSKIEQAKAANQPNILDYRLPISVSIEEAEQLHANLIQMLNSGKPSEPIEFSPVPDIKTESIGKLSKKQNLKETLLIKANANQLDYSEMQQVVEREKRLKVPQDYLPSIASSKKDEIKLKQHQIEGVAWLQHLVANSPQDCRGAVLADDMGLGKTLQLLTVLAAHYEKNPSSSPSLIVTPIALMDNWNDESKKFYNSFPEILILHGKELTKRRQPRSLIDEELLDKKISSLLISNWLGDAKIVLTTYEAVRDYEFSLAQQDFYFLICDEAQKIKTPNALVTLAVKKQKASFRIACTGTPVENTLVDLWCLFDFVQPGLLGDLNEFGKKYRQPIETKTDSQAEARSLLRRIIEPQILRRMKEDVEDLPEKIKVVNDKYEFESKERERLRIEISNYQRELYGQGLKLLRAATNESNAKQRANMSFDVLHLIKAICAEPYCRPRTIFDIDSYGHDVHLFNSPKLKWTLDQLVKIKGANEKVIIFTELREIQRALLIFIKHIFGFTPFLINGDTEERKHIVDQFEIKPGFGVIVLSPLAAGFGLNIVSANHVIHYSRTWNPAKEGQATDRAYRIGQTKDVYVYCPTIVANDFVTFEDKLDRIMSTKMDLAGDMLDGVGADISFADLMPEDSPLGSDIKFDESVDMATVDGLDGEGFEIFCKMLLGRASYMAYVTSKNRGDGGVDLVIISNESTGLLCQCKHTSQAELGWDAVKEIAAGSPAYQTKHPNIRFQRVAICNKEFNGAAKLQASTLGVRLIERDEISQILIMSPMKRIMLDEELIRH